MHNNKIYLVLISGLLGIVFLFTISSVLKSRIHNLDQQWMNVNQSVLIKIELLEHFYRDFGYTGFIHHYKNFLLRKKFLYLVNAQKKLTTSLKWLEQLKKLKLNQSELGNVDKVKRVALEYQDMLHKLNEIIHKQPDLSISEIDKIVRVKDEPAAIALEQMFNSFNTINKKEKKQLKENLDSSIFYLNFLLYILLPIIVLVMSGYIIYILRLDKSFNEIKAIFLSSPSALIISDNKGHIINQNDNTVKLLGYSKEEFKSMVIEDLIEKKHANNHAHLRKQFVSEKESLLKDKVFKYVMGHDRNLNEFHVKAKDNSLIPVTINLTSFTYGNNVRIISSLTDLREKKLLEEISYTDGLTNINNRRCIDNKLIEEFDRAHRYGRSLAVILLDIDFFKQVNDQYGHDVGDKVLISIADILKTRVRNSDTVGRFGGEEFLIICPETSKGSALELAQNIKENIALTIHHNLNNITASFGVSVLTPEVDSKLTSDNLLKQADDALYYSKNNGRNRVSFYDDIKSSIIEG